MLLTDHRQVESITRGLIALTKMSPHLKDSTEAYKLRSKLRKKTGSENSHSTSVIITPFSVSIQIVTINIKSI